MAYLLIAPPVRNTFPHRKASDLMSITTRKTARAEELQRRLEIGTRVIDGFMAVIILCAGFIVGAALLGILR